jgi:hypothetical protein
MKTTTLKVVFVTLIFALAASCGKRSANSLTVTKAGPGSGVMDWSDMFYNPTPTATNGEYQYLISGTPEKPKMFLKSLGTDKKIFFQMTLALIKSDGKAVKANTYQLVYDEYITCNDGPSSQGGTTEVRITHATSNDTWTAVKGVISLTGAGSISRDPTPPQSTDPKTNRVTKYPKPKSGKMSISANIGEPEILKASLSFQSALYPYDYTKIVKDNAKSNKADAIVDIDKKGVCKNVKATSADIATPAPTAPATANDLQESN